MQLCTCSANNYNFYACFTRFMYFRVEAIYIYSLVEAAYSHVQNFSGDMKLQWSGQLPQSLHKSSSMHFFSVWTLIGYFRLWTGHGSSYWVSWKVKVQLPFWCQDAFIYRQIGVMAKNMWKITCLPANLKGCNRKPWVFIDIRMCFGRNIFLTWITWIFHNVKRPFLITMFLISGLLWGL